MTGKTFSLWVAMATVVLSGCANTLQPLGSKDVRVDIPHLSGNWIVSETSLLQTLNDARVKIARSDTGLYTATLTEEGQVSTWNCQTLKLNETTFVDLVPLLDAVDDQQRAADMLTLTSHVVLALEVDGDQIKLFGFDHGKLDVIAMNEGLVLESSVNNRVIYIAKTSKLQQFFGTTGAAHLQKTRPVLTLKRSE